MASNFSFSPMGLSQAVTVAASAATVTLSVVQGTTTLSVTSGAYRPTTIRVVNGGSVAAFLSFGASAPTVSVATGMEIRANSDATFRIVGQPALAYISAGTTTLNITPGEGL